MTIDLSKCFECESAEVAGENPRRAKLNPFKGCSSSGSEASSLLSPFFGNFSVLPLRLSKRRIYLNRFALLGKEHYPSWGQYYSNWRVHLKVCEVLKPSGMTSGFQLSHQYRIMGSSNRSIQDLMIAQVDKRVQRKLFPIVSSWIETLSGREERYSDGPALVSFL